MRKILIMIMLSATLVCSAYDGVAQLFADESGELFNSLSFSARYQMLNNYYNTEKSEVLNNLQTNESRILTISHDHMVVATSSGKTVELKLLPQPKNDTVIAVVETVATPVKDSRISFYDLKWKRLDDTRFITKPEINDFILPQAPKKEREELVNLVNFTMIEMAFEDNTLVARCNLQDFYMGDDFKHYAKWINNRITYVIDKGKLKRR